MQDLHGYYLEDLKVNMTGAYAKTIKVVLDGEATCSVDCRADIVAMQKAIEAMTQ